MTHRSTTRARFALSGVALAAACLWGTSAHALGLGRLSVQSALGEALRAEIEITSMTAEEASSLRLRVAPPEAYRAAGVDYNAALPSAQVSVQRRADGRNVVRIVSDRAVLEPFVDVILEATWTSGRLVREYTLLFDPPGSRLAAAAPQPAPATAPVISPAPAAPAVAPAAQPPAPPAVVASPVQTPPAAPAAAPLPAPAPAPRAAAPAPAPRPATPPVAAAAPAPRPEGGPESVRVRQGDTLSRIASRTQRPGISLDQMLVSLFRSNPQAFMGENMNRLKSGAVLTVPTAEAAAGVTAPQAREIILAQSADFDAYRQRLASGTTVTADTAPSRQATGQVQAQVDDRRQGAAPTPDKLTLSQGAVKPSAPEAQASREAEKRDASARLAELSRNVDELKKLQGATAPLAAASAPAPVVAAAPVAAAPAPAPVPEPPASAPVASPPAPAVVAAAPKPAPAPPPPQEPEEPGLVASLLENPLVLPAAGVLVALLAGLGLWRVRGRLRKQAGETSFLESRLQPDSFFGASGGQRIDTHDAPAPAGPASSNTYSLSQLDAIGDVDPVAEADVYLAYGRDLQAEEILKEAMRANPERMAIRLKLLEVYAKRRDSKGFELLATQVYNLTQGQGEDWAKAQALGLGIDPDNRLYQPGGRPDEVIGAAGQPVEALGASTVPFTAPASPPAFVPAPDATLSGGLDLDLDLGGPAPARDTGPPSDFGLDALPEVAPGTHEATQAFVTGAEMARGDSLDFDLSAPEPFSSPAPAPTAPAAPTAATPMMDDGLDFDLGDLGGPTPAPAPAPAAQPDLDLSNFPLESPADALAPADDALARKLELAEEFRQIGDLEGARDLIEEVVAKADGALRTKAQGMLDQLA